ncbi:unnamed protein product [Prorocentrum cordatum]|uniref:Uncharacterized protein n=1 Tax=Prorocentrum cordatum TaxID=2364126 RepID=A0ABN9QCV2_9DINO|nr:unnamed protein product [Polarella glacialis]
MGLATLTALAPAAPAPARPELKLGARLDAAVLHDRQVQQQHEKLAKQLTQVEQRKKDMLEKLAAAIEDALGAKQKRWTVCSSRHDRKELHGDNAKYAQAAGFAAQAKQVLGARRNQGRTAKDAAATLRAMRAKNDKGCNSASPEEMAKYVDRTAAIKARQRVASAQRPAASGNVVAVGGVAALQAQQTAGQLQGCVTAALAPTGAGMGQGHPADPQASQPDCVPQEIGGGLHMGGEISSASSHRVGPLGKHWTTWAARAQNGRGRRERQGLDSATVEREDEHRIYQRHLGAAGQAQGDPGFRGNCSLCNDATKTDGSAGEDPLTGWTPLCAAAAAGNEACVRWLLGRRCDPSHGAAWAETPLHLAAMRGSEVAEHWC